LNLQLKSSQLLDLQIAGVSSIQNSLT
jgi:hypothetical protein